MAINPYFRSNYYGKAEQSLVESLTTECIQIHGHDVYYVPRTLVSFDKLYGEDKLSAFEKAIPVEVYLKNVETFGGDKELITQWGVEVRDEIRLTLSKKRFRDEVTRQVPEINYPRAGDLVYIPVDGSLFEITFVEDKEVFYQTGDLFSYELNLKRFEMGSEKFNTGIDVVDRYEEDFGSLTDFVFDNVTGNFMVGERIYQGANLVDSTARAEVVFWDSGTKTLTVSKIFGAFDKNIDTVGNDSGATGTYNSAQDVKPNKNEAGKDNRTVYELSNPIIDVEEVNPNL